MKLTPEQKAFFEYGAARTILSFQITQIKIIAKDLFGEEYKRLPTQERKACCSEVVLNLLIKNVREKRRACMAWVPLECRECQSCRYCEEPDDSEICDSCIVFNRLADACNWEPRKEGE